MASSLAAMPHGRVSAGRRACFACLAWFATLGGVSGPGAAAPKPAEAVFTHPTYSSPIALSADNRFLWSVNPSDDSVSIVRTDRDTVVRKLRVGKEPQSVALDPNNGFAYVANAAGSSVSVIRILDDTLPGFDARVVRTIRTGAEPWNVVISPDGERVFVANSGQDTITVINALNRQVIGQIDLRKSKCNVPDPRRHFQPRGMAVTLDNRQLLVTRFLSFVKEGGKQGEDDGKEGVVCRLRINTAATEIGGYRPTGVIRLAARPTGFAIDSPGDGVPGDGDPEPTIAFPNQLQSIVIRGDRAYLPNIAASPESPLQFQNSTEAFVNVINGVGAGGSDGAALNLHLGARDPEPGKKKLFFANQWAIAFATQTGPGAAYTVAAGSDLLVKLNVDAVGGLSFTVDGDTTRYIDLNDPEEPATSGENAGKNPRGIVITADGAFAYVVNFVSGNISKVDLLRDKVVATIRTLPLPPPGSLAETIAVGAEMFFSSRGHFDRPAHATVSTDERLSSEGWQNCASCHFEGWSDGVVWFFGPGPRKSISLAGSFNPRNREEQRILNYSAQRDETQDFTLNARNVSGPGPLPAPVPCSAAPPDTSTFDPDQGLLVGDADFNLPPCVVNDFVKPNSGRNQVTVTLPGGTPVPALDALNEWLKFAVRVPNGPLTDGQVRGGVPVEVVTEGRRLFERQRCTACHSGELWSTTVKDFAPPPALTDIFCERNVANPLLPNCATDPDLALFNPNAGQYLDRFLENVGSFNLGVEGRGNEIGNNIGAVEKSAAAVVGGVAQAQQDALGKDFNEDGAGEGFGVSSLLGIHAVPPFGHNGACETVNCIVASQKHRTANGRFPDRLANPADQLKVVRFVESIDAQTRPFR